MRSRARTSAWSLFLLALTLQMLAVRDASAQGPRQIERPREPRESEYGTKFFDQLRSLFGRFRDADLQRAFEAAQPIQCSELASDGGEWRQVAFFNEDRRLGDWYHRSLEEVKGDLASYVFKGPCKTEQGVIPLVTKFPVSDSLKAYIADRIDFKDIVVNTNAAVNASYEPNSQAYSFDLPYLYVDRARSGAEPVYSLVAARVTDRYATDVTNHWQCKSVRGNDVTFQFLICQTWSSNRNVTLRSRSKESFGSSAYFILSDGKEATTSVRISFRGTDNVENAPANPEAPKSADRPADPAPPPAPEPPTREGWQIPDPVSKLAAVEMHEFRVRFDLQTWGNKVTSPQILLDQKLLSLAQAPAGVDYCNWSPASTSLVPRVLAPEPDTDVAYTLTTSDGSKGSAPSVIFEMKTHNGSRLGRLQCFFRAESAAAISFDRWSAVVGSHLTVEIRP